MQGPGDPGRDWGEPPHPFRRTRPQPCSSPCQPTPGPQEHHRGTSRVRRWTCRAGTFSPTPSTLPPVQEDEEARIHGGAMDRAGRTAPTQQVSRGGRAPIPGPPIPGPEPLGHSPRFGLLDVTSNPALQRKKGAVEEQLVPTIAKL